MDSIIKRAKELLAAQGQKTELSPQAMAVVQALAEYIKRTKQPKGVMVRPTLEQMIAYGETIDLPKDQCEWCFDHYQSNGWKVGKNPMSSWHSAMSNWKKGWLLKAKMPTNGQPPPKNHYRI